jgi:hypothetical protein
VPLKLRTDIDKLRREYEATKNPAPTNGKAELPEPQPTATAQSKITWPSPLAPPAFHGLAGEIVHCIEPASEADPAALLLQLLVGVGSIVGRGAHAVVEATRHGTNLFMILVGLSSKARKGTSWGHIRRLLESVDEGWAADRVQSGLSSGEGLIAAVRDGQGDDEGVSDKRLLVMQGEFCGALRSMQREGNVLSVVLRDAWDSGHLRNLITKARVATGAHISVIGHITRDELRANLSQTDQGNGFGNRFLWVATKRSKILPEGGVIDSAQWNKVVKALHEAVATGRAVGEMRRDDSARGLWAEVYPELSEGQPGLLGAITSRAEAQVLRLSCLYALLDNSAIVRIEHLQAALACWKYAEDSARYIFGDSSSGDPVVDAIARALRVSDSGLTRTDIRDLFGRNQSAARIDVALNVLLEQNKVTMQKQDSGGRPTELWMWVTTKTT